VDHEDNNTNFIQIFNQGNYPMNTRFLLLLSFLVIIITSCSTGQPADTSLSPSSSSQTETTSLPAPEKSEEITAPTQTLEPVAISNYDPVRLEELLVIDVGAPVNDITWLPDGKELLVFGGDGHIQRLDFSSEKFHHVANDEYLAILGDPFQISPSIFSRPNIFLSGDDLSVAIAMADRVVIFETSEWRQTANYEYSVCSQASAFTPDLIYCAFLSGYSNADSIYPVNKQEDTHAALLSKEIEAVVFPTNSHYYMVAALSPDGKTIFFNNGAGQAGIWNFETADLRYRMLDGCPESYRSHPFATYTPDGRYILSKDCYKSYFWDTETGELINISDIPLYSGVYEPFYDLGLKRFSPGGRYLISVNEPITSENGIFGPMSVVDMLVGENFIFGVQLSVTDQVFTEQALTGFSFSPDGSKFAVSYSDGFIHIIQIVGPPDQAVSLSQLLPRPNATPTPTPAPFEDIDFEALILQPGELSPWLRLSGNNASLSSVPASVRNLLKPERVISQDIRGDYRGQFFLFVFSDPTNAAKAYEMMITHADFGSPIEPLEVGELGSIKKSSVSLITDPYTEIAFYRCNYAVYFKIFDTKLDKLAEKIDQRLSGALCPPNN
jgi:WD40 repeat protein